MLGAEAMWEMVVIALWWLEKATNGKSGDLEQLRFAFMEKHIKNLEQFY